MIYAEILGNIRSSLRNGEKPTITRIQLKVNVPFVRFKEYWEDLKARTLGPTNYTGSYASFKNAIVVIDAWCHKQQEEERWYYQCH
jgi:predicted transcriptional regulator